MQEQNDSGGVPCPRGDQHFTGQCALCGQKCQHGLSVEQQKWLLNLLGDGMKKDAERYHRNESALLEAIRGLEAELRAAQGFTVTSVTFQPAMVPRGHCNRCDRCGWEFGANCGCWLMNCSMRPMPQPRTHCAGCGAPYEGAPVPVDWKDIRATARNYAAGVTKLIDAFCQAYGVSKVEIERVGTNWRVRRPVGIGKIVAGEPDAYPEADTVDDAFRLAIRTVCNMQEAAGRQAERNAAQSAEGEVGA
jgi:hypothetical protein